MYNKAIEHGFCKSNPAEKIKQFNFDNKIERYLDDDELARLLAVLEKDSNKTVANIILVLLTTGMRLNEVLTSKWQSVDWKHKTITIDATRSKSGKKRVVPLNDMAFDILSKLETKGKHTHLFVSSRSGQPLTTIRKQFIRIIGEAKIVGFRIHDLRHCFCSYALQQGRSIAEVSQLAGHSSVQITMRYAHFAKNQLHDASNSAANHIVAVREANTKK
jgi:integrase